MSLEKQSVSFDPVTAEERQCSFSEGLIPAGDGERLFARCWTPCGAVKANIVLTHGMGEHSARYFHVGEFFAARGFRLCTYDLRGHGRSPGRRGDVGSYRVLLDDLQR